MQNKSDSRKILLSKRAKIEPTQRESAAIQAAKIFLNSHLFQSNQHIACYLPQPDEFDCTPIIRAIWTAQKNCYVPILPGDKTKKLSFVLYHSGDSLRLNQYHIFEPELASVYPTEKLDIVLVPLLGFDEKGNRLGRGGGYYDATFSFLLDRYEQKPLLLGLAYSDQKTSQLSVDSWDVKLDGVLTEQGLIIFE